MSHITSWHGAAWHRRADGARRVMSYQCTSHQSTVPGGGRSGWAQGGPGQFRMGQGEPGGPGAQGKPWPQPRVLSFSPAPRALRARGAVLLPCKISNFRGEFLRALIFLFPLKQLSYNASAARQVAALRSAVRRSAEARAVRASHRRSAAAWHCAAKHGIGAS